MNIGGKTETRFDSIHVWGGDDALVLCDGRSNLSYLVIYSQKHEQRNANLIKRSIFDAETYLW